MPCVITCVTCHPAEVTFPPLPQPRLVLNLATSEGCKALLTYHFPCESTLSLLGFLSPLVPKEDKWHMFLCIICPSCHSNKNIKALKETQSTNASNWHLFTFTTMFPREGALLSLCWLSPLFSRIAENKYFLNYVCIGTKCMPVFCSSFLPVCMNCMHSICR